MKNHLRTLITDALTALAEDSDWDIPGNLSVPVERARDREHGDFATPVTLGLARIARCSPRDLAEKLVARIPSSAQIARVEIAGPGFINFFLSDTAYQQLAADIVEQGEAFGRVQQENAPRVQVEFVSANPTGPLHVGHGRGAAYGAAVADLLEATGYRVEREYYVNDAGRQMDILATSVWLRYLELCGEEISFPGNGYQGDYIWDIAASVHRQQDEALRVAWDELVDACVQVGDDPERYMDALIEQAKARMDADAYRGVLQLALDALVGDIRDDLRDFGISFERWYSERSLAEAGAVEGVVERLRAAGHIYEQDGAQWFRSTDFGDEKDRVVIRDNGQATYFASDIAYHLDKVERGFNRIIDIWGADHHGYVARVKAALQALGIESACLDVRLVQFANLYRGGEKLSMSTRSGEFITLRELRKEVGNDAARFFYVLRKSEQHLDFDLDLAVSQSNENPVYYVQYAHARVCSVLRQMQERGFDWDLQQAKLGVGRLQETHELGLLRVLSRYPEVLEVAAEACEPHQLAFYLRELATEFHTYYNAHKFLVDDAELRDARVTLALATRQVIGNGLRLLGVSAPESM